MWKLLYDSLVGFKVVDLQDIAPEDTKHLIEEYGDVDLGIKETLIQLFGLEDVHKERGIKRIYVIYENDKLVGILYGDHTHWAHRPSRTFWSAIELMCYHRFPPAR